MSEIMKIVDTYSCEQCNILYSALKECSKDWAQINKIPLDQDDYYMYGFMENTPRASFVVLLIDKMNENGFKIVKGISQDE